MTEPTPMKQQTTEEKYNELYELLKGKLRKSIDECRKEFLKKIALSGMPERPTYIEESGYEVYYCGSDVAVIRNEAAKILAKEAFLQKFNKLNKDLEDAHKLTVDNGLPQAGKEKTDEAQKHAIANAEEELFNFLFENYKGKDDFKDEEKALKEAKDALKAAEKELSEKIKHAESELDKSEGDEATSEPKAKIDALKIDEELFEAVEAAKVKFTKAVIEYINNPDNQPDLQKESRYLQKELEDTSEFIEKLKAIKEITNWMKKAKKTNDVVYSKEAISLLERLKSAEEFDEKLNEIDAGVFSKGFEAGLEQLQDLEKEINSSKAFKDKTVKPSFSARVKSSFETAMNYLKKNQNTLRNIAGGLLATVFIYNIAAIIAGFNAFALMASIATLTSTLPLVLASAEIALITFAGTSLIAYTATSDKVRKACSLEGLKPSTQPGGSEPELTSTDSNPTP